MTPSSDMCQAPIATSQQQSADTSSTYGGNDNKFHNLLAAYEGRRQRRLRDLNAWFQQAVGVAGHDQASSLIITCAAATATNHQYHDSPTMSVTAESDGGSSDDLCNCGSGYSSESLTLHESSRMARLPPFPQAESHPDDVFFKSCKDLGSLVDFSELLSNRSDSK